MHPSGVFCFSSLIFLAACGSAPPTETAAIEQVRSAHSVTILDDAGQAQTLLLAGVTGPDLDAAPEAARRARAALEAEIASAVLTHLPVGDRDRYGRIPSVVRTPDGDDLAITLVEAGWLVVWPRLGQDADFAALFGAEARARAAEAGGWGEGAFAVRDPDPNGLAQQLDSAQIVEGRVVSTGAARDGRVFLNFGLDWRTDFTAVADEEAVERFAEAGVDLGSLEGAVIRIRGWLFELNGPTIALNHPAQLEIVDAPTASTISR
jgi:micrococcal nuclease